METIKFKTNINCSGCVNAVTPFLNRLDDISGWHVDTSDPEKMLTVIMESTNAQTVKQAVEKAGFKADLM
jgi:copper chaperone CopZ